MQLLRKPKQNSSQQRQRCSNKAAGSAINTNCFIAGAKPAAPQLTLMLVQCTAPTGHRRTAQAAVQAQPPSSPHTQDAPSRHLPLTAHPQQQDTRTRTRTQHLRQMLSLRSTQATTPQAPFSLKTQTPWKAPPTGCRTPCRAGFSPRTGILARGLDGGTVLDCCVAHDYCDAALDHVTLLLAVSILQSVRIEIRWEGSAGTCTQQVQQTPQPVIWATPAAMTHSLTLDNACSPRVWHVLLLWCAVLSVLCCVPQMQTAVCVPHPKTPGDSIPGVAA